MNWLSKALFALCLARISGGEAAWAQAQYLQQGAKLVGPGSASEAFGTALAISSDGSTAIVGAPYDNTHTTVGSAYIYIRTSGGWSQQAKLFSVGLLEVANEGASVGLSADGNTAIVGAPGYNGFKGAAFVYTRSGGSWTQQGQLIGTGVSGPYPASQGGAVAISGDGNTAIVGGTEDNTAGGSAFVFTRVNGAWSQQGTRLIGTGGASNAGQGASVALSADGSTAAVGGYRDGGGSVWVFTRANGAWTQQGAKLTPNDSVGGAEFGRSVALSADGNTLLGGGPTQYGSVGAGWAFIRGAGGVWSQQGPKLVGSDSNADTQGAAVALSADGNTALIGGPGVNDGFAHHVGAAWLFTRGNGAWSQHGLKLVGTGPSGGSRQGVAVALSGDGATAFVGGSFDANPNNSLTGGKGAAWRFTRRPVLDFNGDSTSDILWFNAGANSVGMYKMSAGIPTWVGIGQGAPNWSIVGIGDFNGDGTSDILWYNSATLSLGMYRMQNGVPTWVGIGQGAVGWSIVGIGDFDGDGTSDILWYNSSTLSLGMFRMQNGVPSWVGIGQGATGWGIVGIGDFDGDGTSDILWYNSSTLSLGMYRMQNGVPSWVGIGQGAVGWSIVGIGDFDGDGTSDILWYNTSTFSLGMYRMQNGVPSWVGIGQGAAGWAIVGTGDYDGDGTSDILWYHPASLAVGQFRMVNGVPSWASIGPGAAGWQIVNK